MVSSATLARISSDIIECFKLTYEEVLSQAGKIVSGKNRDSIRGEITTDADGLTITIYADESLQYIERGRRPGGKLPVRKVAGTFELFPELARWKVLVGYTGTDYQLAFAIAKNGIQPTPITSIVIERMETKVPDIIRRYIPEMEKDIAKQITNIYSKL